MYCSTRDTSRRDFYIMTLVIGKPDLEFRQEGIQQLRGPNFTLLKSSASLAKIYHRFYINAVKSKLESSFVVGILPASRRQFQRHQVSPVGIQNSSKILQEFL